MGGRNSSPERPSHKKGGRGILIWIWIVGITLALGTAYLWRSGSKPQEKSGATLPPFEEKTQKDVGPPEKPESLTGQIRPQGDLPLVAIVIDDLGYQRQLAMDFMALDIPLTLSFLPQAPYARELAKKALQKGQESLLHLPMEPKAYPKTDPGPEALLGAMADSEIRQIVEKDLETFPQVVGVNNHMGSRFTEDREKMTLVLKVLKKRNLFFLDSRTTPHSVVLDLASQLGVRAIGRDIFLDNKANEEAIGLQLEKLIRLAQERGFAVACGHPHPQTLRAIKEKIPELRDKVRLVPLSRLL